MRAAVTVAMLISLLAPITLRSQVPTYVPTNGLIGWWPLDGNANGALGGADGTVNTARPSTNRYGSDSSALAFNGSQGSVTLPTSLVFNPGDNQYTLSLWVRIDDTSKPLNVFLNTIPHNWLGIGFNGYHASGQVALLVGNGTGWLNDNDWTKLNATYQDGAWFHLTVVKEGPEYRLYHNAKLMNSAVFSQVPSSSTQLCLGSICGFPTDEVLKGALDDFGYWRRALSTAEIEALYNGTQSSLPDYVPTNDLIGWWPFNGNANDESGNGNDGTVTGAFLTKDRDGVANSAYTFDGIDDVIQTPNQTLTGSVSFSGWYKMSSFNTPGNDMFYVSNQSMSSDIYSANIAFGFRSYQGEYGHSTYIASPLTGYYATNNLPTTDVWHHIVCVYEKGAYVRMYLDTVLIYQNTNVITNPSQASLPLLIGGTGTTSAYYYKGELDDVGVWNRALSHSEIKELYKAGDCIPPNPIVIGPASVCTGSTGTYRTSRENGRSYYWQVSSGGVIAGSSTLDSVVISWRSALQWRDTLRLRETILLTGCSKDTFMLVGVYTPPEPKITGEDSTCVGDFVGYTKSSPSPGFTSRWIFPSEAKLVSGDFAGSGSVLVVWTKAGNHSIRVREETSTQSGCSRDVSVVVRVADKPSVIIEGPSLLCLSAGRGNTYSVPTTVPGATYAWTLSPASIGTIVSGASSNQVTIDWLQRGTATLRASVTGPTGCTRDSLLTITVQDSLRPAITSASGFAMCQGDSLRLDAGSGYSSYTWYEGTTVVGTTRYYTTTKAARYVVQVSNGGCSGSSTAITTTVTALPTVTVSENPAGTLLATTNAGQAQYQWYNAASTPWTPLTGATQATYAPATSGTYGVDVTNTTTGCVSRSTAYTITIGPPPTDPVVTAVQSAITVCRGYTANARVVITGGKPPYRITWTLAGTGTVLNRDVDYILVPMTTDGVLRCSVIDANDRSDSADIAITVVPVPTVQISQAAPDRLLANCDNPAATYQWYTIDGTGWRVIAGATQQSYSPANDGQFGVEASTECTVRSSSFTFIAPPPQTLVVNDYDFGSLPVDDLINASGGHVGSVQVYNRTGSYLELTGASTDDTSTFVVPQQWPRRMNDGDTAEIAVRFLPQDKRAYTTKLNVTTNTTYSGTGTITGTGRDLLPDERVTQVILRPTRSEVEPGDTISVMLMVSVERPVQTAGAAGRYLSTIQWDYRVLEPLSTPGMGYDTSGTYAVANVSNGFRQQNQVQLYRFRFRAKQAEVDSTSIIFSGAKGFVWQDDRKAYPALVDSVVRVRVCRDGGPQLVGRVLPARIVRATPTPARDAVDVELNLESTSTSTGTIDIVTADGRRVKTHNVNQHTKNLRIDLTDLSAGIYTIMLTTSTGADHISMVVVP